MGQSSFHFILYQEGFEVEIELKVFRKGILGVGGGGLVYLRFKRRNRDRKLWWYRGGKGDKEIKIA